MPEDTGCSCAAPSVRRSVKETAARVIAARIRSLHTCASAWPSGGAEPASMSPSFEYAMPAVRCTRAGVPRSGLARTSPVRRRQMTPVATPSRREAGATGRPAMQHGPAIIRAELRGRDGSRAAARSGSFGLAGIPLGARRGAHPWRRPGVHGRRNSKAYPRASERILPSGEPRVATSLGHRAAEWPRYRVAEPGPRLVGPPRKGHRCTAAALHGLSGRKAQRRFGASGAQRGSTIGC